MTGNDARAACTIKGPKAFEWKDLQSFVLEHKGLLKKPFKVRGSQKIYNWDVTDKDLSFEDAAGVSAFVEEHEVELYRDWAQDCVSRGLPPFTDF